VVEVFRGIPELSPVAIYSKPRLIQIRFDR